MDIRSKYKQIIECHKLFHFPSLSNINNDCSVILIFPVITIRWLKVCFTNPIYVYERHNSSVEVKVICSSSDGNILIYLSMILYVNVFSLKIVYSLLLIRYVSLYIICIYLFPLCHLIQSFTTDEGLSKVWYLLIHKKWFMRFKKTR